MKYKNVWKKTLIEEERVIKEFTLGKRYIISIQIFIGIFAIIYLLLSSFFSLIFIILIFVTNWYLEKSNAYCFTNKRVLIHRGWPSTYLISMKYDKITDISIKESFLERLILQTGSLSINTAGTSKQEAILKHIEKPYHLKKELDSIIENNKS